ncbi:hypothetical protein NIES2100_51260 [Calothrix sp. NIES-2100]|uniref:GspE/PulE/PilB domain-containing protein n=1 Tax=Calothrix sp. NIES-2100 TaxID=1954172 RepID=UPI000B606E30|nr:hypothetical protein NIES2100_51260 [Calothrix sp. NIES-2100]
MLSSEGKFTDNEKNVPDANAGTGEPDLKNLEELLGDREQIFSLIDSLLSLEVCLYHQILPLEYKGNKLLLAMVNPQESEALDYLRRILSSIKYTIVNQPIKSDIHQDTLKAYLNYKNTYPANPKQKHQPKVNFTAKNSVVPPIDSIDPLNTSATTYIENRTEILPPDVSSSDSSLQFNHNHLSGTSRTNHDRSQQPKNFTVLPEQTSEKIRPLESLTTLPPKQLLEELLSRVLLGGIGRLYLERQFDQGRILWSDNGVLQSIIENLPLSVFQGIINEFKQFAGLPVEILAEAKQVEKEWQYQNNNLLLRLRVMPGIYGEEATLQVLRGAALKFYQQQQLHRLSRDTLVMAQKLSFKLHELEQRLVLNSSLQSEQLNAVVALSQLVENLNKQLNVLARDSQLPKNNN